MLTKIKAGDLEYIFPNEETAKIIITIIEQNQTVLNMNHTLIETLAKPLFYTQQKENQ